MAAVGDCAIEIASWVERQACSRKRAVMMAVEGINICAVTTVVAVGSKLKNHTAALAAAEVREWTKHRCAIQVACAVKNHASARRPTLIPEFVEYIEVSRRVKNQSRVGRFPPRLVPR